MGRKTPADWLVPLERVSNNIQAQYLIGRSIHLLNKRDGLLAWMSEGHGGMVECRQIAKMNDKIKEIDRDLIRMGCRLTPHPKLKETHAKYSM